MIVGLRFNSTAEKGHEMFAIDNIMKTEVLVAAPEESIRAVISRMGGNKVSGLCMVDEQRRILGVITEYDLLRAFHEDRTDENVGRIMSQDVVTVNTEATLGGLIELFLEKRLRRVFVAEDRVLRGVVSRRDLIFAAQCRRQLTDWQQAQLQ